MVTGLCSYVEMTASARLFFSFISLFFGGGGSGSALLSSPLLYLLLCSALSYSTLESPGQSSGCRLTSSPNLPEDSWPQFNLETPLARRPAACPQNSETFALKHRAHAHSTSSSGVGKV
ncbi:hypothetical protein PZA11_004500 [Diplocarpon coronariae]